VEDPFARSVDLLHFFLGRVLGGPVHTLIEGIGRVACVNCARAKAEGGRPLCVGALYVGVALVLISLL
jgi:hypothetical protein